MEMDNPISAHHFIGIPGQDFSGRIFTRRALPNPVTAAKTSCLRHGAGSAWFSPARFVTGRPDLGAPNDTMADSSAAAAEMWLPWPG
jgi:hypothetical protein